MYRYCYDSVECSFFFMMKLLARGRFVFHADVKCKGRDQEFSLGSCNRYTAALRNAVQHAGSASRPEVTTAKRCSATKHTHVFHLRSPMTGLLNHHGMLIRMAWEDSHTEQVRIVVILQPRSREVLGSNLCRDTGYPS
jgi:hypothetical protein